MATRTLLTELAAAWTSQSGREVHVESVGGVDAARRVLAGEPFDAVVLAADAIDRLAAAGRIETASRVDLVRSKVAVAVRLGAHRPRIGSESELRNAVRAARFVGYSTGPSGTQLMRLFARWGIDAELADRLVQAPPGVPVGVLVARGDVELGFQQFSELKDADGVDVLGLLPAPIEIVTTFAASVCTASADPHAARAVLRAWASPAFADAIRRHGMEPA
jgi:molybdate transport system substrate-binding protein